jgi:hypothetical protein
MRFLKQRFTLIGGLAQLPFRIAETLNSLEKIDFLLGKSMGFSYNNA